RSGWSFCNTASGTAASTRKTGADHRIMESTHLLLVHAPDNPAEVFARLESRRPWSRIAPGELLRVRGLRLRVCETELDVVDGRPVLRAYTVRDNVVAMPPRSASPIADFYRYHAFVERFGCDPDA